MLLPGVLAGTESLIAQILHLFSSSSVALWLVVLLLGTVGLILVGRQPTLRYQ